MTLLIPLLSASVAVRVIAWLLARRGGRFAYPWNSWPAALAAGMAMVFVCAAVTHFAEPQRSGYAAIVPPLGVDPYLVISLSGLAEFTLAIGLVVPHVRVWASAASVLFLVVVFPANAIAAAGVDNPAAPSTPLLPRLALQLAFIAAAASPLVARLIARRKHNDIARMKAE